MKLMRNLFINILCIVAFVQFISCSKNDGGTGPKPDPEFPASTKFAVTLYSPKTSLSVNETFDVKVVLYNVIDLFGATVEIGYASSKVQMTGTTLGTAAFAEANVLTVSRIEPDSSRASYGVTYKAGTSSGFSGSGVMVTFHCKALAAGADTLKINPTKLELKKSDGNAITNFSSFLKENLALTIQ